MTKITKATPEQAARLDKARSMRLGLAGLCRILASTVHKRSTADLAAQHGVDHTTMLFTLRGMLKMGLVHRVDWFRPAPHSRLVPYWLIGGDGDTCVPRGEERPRRPRPPRHSLLLIGTVIQLLQERCYSSSELADELKMHVESAQRLIKMLRKVGLVHVETWQKALHGTTVAEYRYGSRRDANRPPQADPRAQGRRHSADYRGRQRQLVVLRALAGVSANAEAFSQQA